MPKSPAHRDLYLRKKCKLFQLAKNMKYRAGGIAEVVECLRSTHEALS
jgi:hypothetical protein